jgi:O-succinylbenzoic acid--CoA ligase
MDPASPLTDRYWDDPEPDVRLNPALADGFGDLREALRRDGSWEGHVFFATSGSSGGPGKVVALRKQALATAAAWANRHLGCGSDDRWLLALPTFHVGGFGVLARAWAAGGNVAALPGKWDAEAFIRLAETAGATVTSLVPAQLHDLLRTGRAAPSSLRMAVLGGGPLDPGLRATAGALGWEIRESYGMTETAAMVATQRSGADPAGWIPLIPDWEANCRGGLIHVRGAPLLTAYLERSGDGTWRRRDPRDADGWFDTGDLGEMDDAGRLRVRGRAGRVVKILGELVDLDRLDLVLAALRPEGDMVLEATPDDRAGWRLGLVTESDEVTAQRVREAFDRRVAPFERISGVRAVKRLARSALGKRLPQPATPPQDPSSD